MSGNSEKNDRMRLQGQHMLADLFGVDSSKLKDPAAFIGLLKNSAIAANLTPSGEPHVERYGRDGCAGCILLKEPHSHISFHAYPEEDYIAIDIFTSGDNDPERVFDHLVETFTPQMVRKTTISRGLQD